MRLPLLAALLCGLALPAAAEIYRYTDANGRQVFTSQPPDGVSAAPVELPPANSVEMRIPDAPPPLPDDTAGAARAPYARLALRLQENQSIRANSGDFTVQVDIQPPLRPEHRLVLLVDGTPQGAPSASPSLVASGLARGEHQLAVEVQGNRGVIQRSEPLSVHVQRVSINSPARQGGGTP